jgi:predicted glycosyltransferase
VIGQALLDNDPTAEVALVTGLALDPGWLVDPRMTIVRVPPLMKMTNGVYRGVGMGFDKTIAARQDRFLAAVELFEPSVVVVDRHPYGVSSELREGLRRASRMGARLVLGLRDVLDEPDVVAAEMTSESWTELPDTFNHVLVYGSQEFCDHQREYGLSLTPTYCGWVVDKPPVVEIDPTMLIVAAGGGGDGADAFKLGVETAELRRDWRVTLVTGPYADVMGVRRAAAESAARRRLFIELDVPGCGPLFARAGATLQMAGYNSTFEALAAGIRPILVPRRHPRREQLIRASRLAALGLADVLDEDIGPADVSWLLDHARRLDPERLETAGISLDGAQRAATFLAQAAGGAKRQGAAARGWAVG